MPTAMAAADPLLCALVQPHPVFQWHGYTFDAPAGTTHLARSELVQNQAFRYGKNAYGFQFHLELDERLINRWLSLPSYLDEIARSGVPHDAEHIRRETHELIGQSAALSSEVFGQFLKPMGQRASRHVLPSR
jgi:GMP synthase (glutamine-hydrolysing)